MQYLKREAGLKDYRFPKIKACGYIYEEIVRVNKQTSRQEKGKEGKDFGLP